MTTDEEQPTKTNVDIVIVGGKCLKFLLIITIDTHLLHHSGGPVGLLAANLAVKYGLSMRIVGE